MFHVVMLFALTFFSLLSPCASQPFFLDVTDTNTFPDGVPPGVDKSSVGWSDFNNDGLPDFLLTGDDGSKVTKLYMQNSTGVFLDVTDNNTFPDGLPPGVDDSSIAWSDFNNDGLPDFLLTGSAGSAVTKLYMQNSTGVFLDVTDNNTFPGGVPPDVRDSSVAWEDFNNDGFPDFLLTGYNGSTRFTKLYMQNSTGVFLDVTDNNTFPDGVPPTVHASSVGWSDFNNDGLPDFLLTGRGFFTQFTKLYMQNSTGVFLDVTNTNTFPGGVPPRVYFSSVGWSDFNNDGLPDFLLTGSVGAGLVPVTKLYMQNSTGVFLDVTNTNTFPGGVPPRVDKSSIAWSDFNNDGLPDFLLTGQRFSTQFTKLYMQNSTGVFLDVTDNNTFPDGLPPGVDDSSIAWSDFNNDGLPDFLLTGLGASGEVTKLYMNGCPIGFVLNETTCTPCDGFRSTDHRDCIICSLDTYFDEASESCKPCIGVVSANQTMCTPCPLDTYFNETMTSCEPCDEGQIPNENQTGCVDDEGSSSNNAAEESSASNLYSLFSTTFQVERRLKRIY